MKRLHMYIGLVWQREICCIFSNIPHEKTSKPSLLYSVFDLCCISKGYHFTIICINSSNSKSRFHYPEQNASVNIRN